MTVDPTVFAASAVVVIGALAAAVVLIINAIGKVKKDLLDAANVTGAKTEEIHHLVDGTATKAAEKLTAMETQIASLHAQLEQLQERRVEDAKTKAASGV